MIRFIKSTAVFVSCLALWVGMFVILVEWMAGCGETYYTHKGKQIGECVFMGKWSEWSDAVTGEGK